MSLLEFDESDNLEREVYICSSSFSPFRCSPFGPLVCSALQLRIENESLFHFRNGNGIDFREFFGLRGAVFACFAIVGGAATAPPDAEPSTCRLRNDCSFSFRCAAHGSSQSSNIHKTDIFHNKITKVICYR